MAHREKNINQFPSDPGPAAWNALLPPRDARAPLDEKRTADWVVIGAGFTGLSAARRIAELHPSDSVVVLEASCVAEGPAGRNSGFMIDLPHVLTSSDYSGDARKDVINIELNRAGIDYALKAKEQYSFNDETIVRSGKINGAITEKGKRHNRDYARYLDDLAEPYERLNHTDMAELTGSESYIDGVFTRGAAMIQPAMFVRKIASAIESNRVRLYENSPVTKLHHEGTTWNVTTRNGVVSSPKVILAVNGHLESFGYYTRSLMHIYTYGSMTAELTREQIKRLSGKSEWAITPADPLGTTVRRISGTGGDRLIVRNRATFNPAMSVKKSWLSDVTKTHDQSFKDRFPMLSDVAMQYRWGGRLCLSRNDVPIFGELEPGLFAACCQNGLGTAKGTISGKLIAEFASGEKNQLIDHMLVSSPPKKLPNKTLATMGANAIIQWGEWRAGKEL